ncbi:hypothetical protein [Jiulongibacter sediminis]|jgi:acyl carrier protein|uniref:hypothetical protein n=1 Tax=Jiulongibacter sediminis TaxID=1605367 RepID=UPI0026F17805|nr:hypothetical protein [Jiulongibacter sediminis]
MSKENFKYRLYNPYRSRYRDLKKRIKDLVKKSLAIPTDLKNEYDILSFQNEAKLEKPFGVAIPKEELESVMARHDFDWLVVNMAYDEVGEKVYPMVRYYKGPNLKTANFVDTQGGGGEGKKNVTTPPPL